MVQQHQSSNSKLEDSTVNTSKTVSYMPGSALCAESTYNTILLKAQNVFSWHFVTSMTLHSPRKVCWPDDMLWSHWTFTRLA